MKSVLWLMAALLNERGYQPIEFTSVMYRPISKAISLAASRHEKIPVRFMREDEHELCAKISAQGWSEHPELADFLLEIGQISAQCENAVSFFAEIDCQPIATGALCLGGGVALLGGACTIPAARKHGAQLALLESRLRYGVEQGCDLAMMCALPGSASQRNGFRIAYTRIKWQLKQRVA